MQLGRVDEVWRWHFEAFILVKQAARKVCWFVLGYECGLFEHRKRGLDGSVIGLRISIRRDNRALFSSGKTVRRIGAWQVCHGKRRLL